MENIQIDTERWARWPEVQRYAEKHGVTIPEAIVDLVNSGLSHEPI